MDKENEIEVEETTETNDEEVEETTDEEEGEDVQSELERLRKENHTLKIQKGKLKAKQERNTVVPDAKTAELSQADILALAKSDIHEDDIDRVTKFAKMEGITVKDALANEDMQAILERRAEGRKVAAASNTGGSAPSSADISGDALLANARQGKMPDAKDLDALFAAEKKRK